MTARFLLDTSVLSEPLRPSPNEGVLAGLEEHKDEMVTAAPVWNELVFGLRRLPASRRKDVVRQYLHDVVRPALGILAYDEAAAEWHGIERARLERIGHPPAFVDGQIAAIARVHGLTLVTRNTPDYQHFEGLRAENWFR